MMEPTWRLEAARSPLLFAYVVNGGGDTPPSLSSVTRVLDEIAAVRGKKVVVVDLLHAKPDAIRRKIFVEWTKLHWASIRSELLGVACIAPSSVQRRIITGVLWLIKPSCPVEVFEHREGAVAWASTTIEAAGLKVPPPAASTRPQAMR